MDNFMDRLFTMMGYKPSPPVPPQPSNPPQFAQAQQTGNFLVDPTLKYPNLMTQRQQMILQLLRQKRDYYA